MHAGGLAACPACLPAGASFAISGQTRQYPRDVGVVELVCHGFSAAPDGKEGDVACRVVATRPTDVRLGSEYADCCGGEAGVGGGE